MKSMMLVLSVALTGLFTQAQAFASVLPDGGLLEPQTFMSCRLASDIVDAALNVRLVKERIGAAKIAVVTRGSIATHVDTVYPGLTSRPKIIEGDMAVGTIYTSRSEAGNLELTVDYTNADANGVSPSTLVLDGGTYDMLCTPYMTVN